MISFDLNKVCNDGKRIPFDKKFFYGEGYLSVRLFKRNVTQRSIFTVEVHVRIKRYSLGWGETTT